MGFSYQKGRFESDYIDFFTGRLFYRGHTGRFNLRGDAATNGWLQGARGAGVLSSALFIASLGRFGFKGRWNKQRLLLTAGDFAAGRFNTMTVGWGSLGTMWGRPFAQVVVRPVRYTFQFTEQYDTFTLCVLPARLQPAWQLLGSKSGRDGDKIAESGLTPVASTRVAAPSFAEAELVIECRKIYWDDIVPGHFLDPAIDRNYPNKDYHRIYFGEILAIHGHEQYKSA